MFRKIIFLNIAMVLFVNMIALKKIDMFNVIFEKSAPEFILLILQSFPLVIYTFSISGFITKYFSSYYDLIITQENRLKFYFKKLTIIFIFLTFSTLNIYLYIIIFDFSNLLNYSILNFANLYLALILINTLVITLETLFKYEISIMIMLIFITFESIVFSLSENSNILMLYYYFTGVNLTKTVLLFIINVITLILMFIIVYRKDRIGEK